MTAVAAPTSFQSLPQLGWNSGDSAQGGLNSMSADDVTRIFMPRKGPQRVTSSSSMASTTSSSSVSSTATVISNASPSTGSSLKEMAEREGWTHRKKAARGLWPSTKPDSASSISNPRPQSLAMPSSGSTPGATASSIHQPSPILPSQNTMQTAQQSNGVRTIVSPGGSDSPAVLILLPMNGTFERKQITVPLFPEILRIGRQTNAKTVPTPLNGYFDSKVLSRQHAEIWADRSGKIWIRDIKSSNGTFVNGTRLSPENRDSEPHELKPNDMLELGIDIVSEDQKSIVHHKVSAKVEHAGIYNNSSGVLDINFGDIDPGTGGGLMGPTYPQHMASMRGRNGGQGSINGNSRMPGQANIGAAYVNGMGMQRSMHVGNGVVTIEGLVRKLTSEIRLARQQSQDLHKTGDFFNALLTQAPGEMPSKANSDALPLSHSQVNGVNGPSQADPMSPLFQPPAPPPQQPLPEKPDMVHSVLADASIQHPFKKFEPERPRSAMNSSPIKSESSSSQILSLVEALTSAKREIDSQGDRVKQLEDLLRQERKARESAEERAKRLLDRSRGLSGIENGNLEGGAFDPPTETTSSEDKRQPNGYEADDERKRFGRRSPKSKSSPPSPSPSELDLVQHETKAVDASTSRLQERLDLMIKEMDEMKTQMESYKRRAEAAENSSTSLAAMVERIRNGEVDAKSATPNAEERNGSELSTQTDARSLPNGDARSPDAESSSGTFKSPSLLNGAPVQSSKDGHDLEDDVITTLAQSTHRNDRLIQSAPYASMLGVVLIGVGIMTYLNGWQKIDRS